MCRAEEGLFVFHVTIILDGIETSIKKCMMPRAATAEQFKEGLLVMAAAVLTWFLSFVNEQVIKSLGGILWMEEEKCQNEKNDFDTI